MNEQFNEFTPSVEIAYIGKKAIWRDTMFRSGTIFNGTFDVQRVDARIAPKLLRFKDCFILAEKLDAYKKDMEKILKESIQAEAKKQAAEKAEEKAEGDDGMGHDPVLIEKIKTAIMAMDSNNEAHFKNGSPVIAAVRSLMPDSADEVTVKALKQAFKDLEAGK